MKNHLRGGGEEGGHDFGPKDVKPHVGKPGFCVDGQKKEPPNQGRTLKSASTDPEISANNSGTRGTQNSETKRKVSREFLSERGPEKGRKGDGPGNPETLEEGSFEKRWKTRL